MSVGAVQALEIISQAVLTGVCGWILYDWGRTSRSWEREEGKRKWFIVEVFGLVWISVSLTVFIWTVAAVLT